jgi:hypothetical protein
VRALNQFREELAAALERFSMDALLGCYVGTDERTGSFGFHNPLIRPQQKDLIDFLFLARPVPLTRLRELFSQRALDEINGLGWVTASPNGAGLQNHRLTFHFGSYILCHVKHAHGFAYYGADSLALGRVIQRCRGNVLDACSGVGAQGIRLAVAGSRVTCVEVNQQCEDLFWFNAGLNGVSERVSFRCSIDQVEGAFDWIVCNPPLLPVPQGVDFPLVGNGGPEGVDVLAQVLRNSSRLLMPAGRIRFVCTMLGDADEPDTSALNAIALEAGLNVDLVVPCRERLAPGELMFEGLVKTAILAGMEEGCARKAFGLNFSGPTRTHLYSIIGTARRGDGHVGLNTISRHYQLNRAFWSL